jgi:hypothetical protein
VIVRSNGWCYEVEVSEALVWRGAILFEAWSSAEAESGKSNDLIPYLFLPCILLQPHSNMYPFIDLGEALRVFIEGPFSSCQEGNGFLP